MKGVVRENCEKLSRTLKYPEPSDPHNTDLTSRDTFRPLRELESPVDKIFGNKFESGRLFFRDARLLREPSRLFLKHQSRICRYRVLGTVRDRHLFSSEYAEPMELTTTIDGFHDNLVCLGKGDPPYAYCILIAGIMTTGRIGGDKSTGCGNVRISFDSVLCDGKPLEGGGPYSNTWIRNFTLCPRRKG